MAGSQWDLANHVPDAVVVNLGTNDFSTNDDPTQEQFESAYTASLRHIRDKYPLAHNRCTNGPMLTDSDLDLVRTCMSCIGDVVQAFNDSGDDKVGSFEIPPQDAADGYGCDGHPSLVTHQKMAEQLKAELKSALGWYTAEGCTARPILIYRWAMFAGWHSIALAVALSAAGLASPRGAHAMGPGSSGPAGVRLSWVRAEGAARCITAQSLERRVAARLGRDPFQGESRQWVDGVVFSEEGGFAVQLFERDAEGNTVGARTLREIAGDCRNLDEAVSLAVALIIDPTAKLVPEQGTAAVRPEATSQTTEPAATGARLRAPSSARAEARACPARTQCPLSRGGAVGPHIGMAEPSLLPGLVVSPVVVRNVFPETAFGVEAATEAFLFRSKYLAWHFGALLLPEKRVHADVGDLGYGLTAFDLGACAISQGDLAWVGCVTLEGGVLHTVVHDPNPLEPGDRPWLAGRAHGGVRLNLPGPVWLEVRLFGTVPITRWQFRVRERGQEPKRAYQQPWFMPGAAIGLGLHFG